MDGGKGFAARLRVCVGCVWEEEGGVGARTNIPLSLWGLHLYRRISFVGGGETIHAQPLRYLIERPCRASG